ncbi:CHAD domain-containing protein [Novosphingobium sp. KCTC 2891]|uniref:CHAD domain-containing protein n=1 Tax=Novosphingobium sp. KCTC 2891 TaxID=2989730 RepID=UPI002222CC4A|nr:CHAD domain-containing protein [Novosphingobium sp. KCTC 2891]MCW1383411.1 CHAD domain-containing protein [Novosphingobium sp. KCTC 2891]
MAAGPGRTKITFAATGAMLTALRAYPRLAGSGEAAGLDRRRIHSAGSTIDVSCGSSATCELKLELVEGRPSDLIALARALPIGPELQWVAPGSAAASTATVPPVTSAMDVARGFRTIAWNCLEHLIANYPAVIASGDAEAVHQSRVALRRLRAACSLFGKVVGDEAAPALRAEMKAVSGVLGEARDLHVLLDRTTACADDAETAEVLAALGARRDAATRSAQELVASAPFQEMLFALAAWIEDGAWLARAQETGGTANLQRFAAHLLARRRRRLRKAGRRLARLTVAERHRLRISAKKLRYASEFFAPLFHARDTIKDRHRFARDLRRLQDSLGELNDAAMMQARHPDLFTGPDKITAARLAERLEGMVALDETKQRRLLRGAGRALEGVSDAPPWWKAG